MFGELPIGERLEELQCGIAVINATTGKITECWGTRIIGLGDELNGIEMKIVAFACACPHSPMFCTRKLLVKNGG